ncbi:organelle RRM domain-containing protein 2, mitochondrial-like isoform X1 [Panicum virgatum]|uniref:organelle RRM domain-containing protein 2, mitochondrial-like isoform X1 n=1 Tax=Panicum virgatum TaxID=38727 RepID=UPI0019D60D71|nr:organelle RRM domain-containing protein 2, mitochondrial-like isoform X1 [Panicum virgatum]
MAAAAARSGFRRMFSISAFAPPKPPAPRPQADPSPNLFVSGLSKRTSTEGLRDAFAKFGEVVHARVVTDRVSGCSKGFGFVRYATTEEAAKGIEGMDGKSCSGANRFSQMASGLRIDKMTLIRLYTQLVFLDGWVIFAEYAKPRPPPQEAEMNSQPQQSWGPPSSSWGSQ